MSDDLDTQINNCIVGVDQLQARLVTLEKELADTKAEYLRRDKDACHRFAEIVDLKGRNTELLAATKQYLSKLETLCSCAESSGCKDAARRAILRDLIAKSEATP